MPARVSETGYCEYDSRISYYDRNTIVRGLTATFLCFWAMLLVPASAFAEPPAQPRIYFAAVTTWGAKSLILLRSFKPGLNVTLLNPNEICKAKTGSEFSFEHLDDEPLKATNVIGIDKCPKAFMIAVVGAGAGSVRLPQTKLDHTPVPKEVEQKARQIVAPDGPSEDHYGVSGSPPEITTVERFTLLRFSLNGENEKDNGPAVLFADGQFFELEGFCGAGHFFFTVRGRLHLAYVENGCGSGRLIWYVYDLSGKTPEIVYSNGDLST
jgi:hypothetical protein